MAPPPPPLPILGSPRNPSLAPLPLLSSQTNHKVDALMTESPGGTSQQRLMAKGVRCCAMWDWGCVPALHVPHAVLTVSPPPHVTDHATLAPSPPMSIKPSRSVGENGDILRVKPKLSGIVWLRETGRRASCGPCCCVGRPAPPSGRTRNRGCGRGRPKPATALLMAAPFALAFSARG